MTKWPFFKAESAFFYYFMSKIRRNLGYNNFKTTNIYNMKFGTMISYIYIKGTSE